MNDWPIKQLVDIADIFVSNVDKKVDTAEKPIKLCNYMDVYSHLYLDSGIDFKNGSATEAEIERFALHAGDVVITKDSETPDDIAIPAVVKEEIANLICGYHLAIIRPDPNELNSVYLAKQLSTHRSKRYFAVQATGSTRYGLPISAIELTDIPQPLLPEQATIAEVLSTVDEAIVESETLIAKQGRIKIGLMQHLCAHGIDSHGKVRSENTHAYKESAVGRIPEEWRTASVAEMFENRRERGKPGLPIMSIVMNDGLVDRSAVDRRVESKLLAEGHALVLKGDIAYNMMRMWQGVLGRAQFDCLISPAYVVLKPKPIINSHFAEWLFRDERSILKFRRASRGVVDDRLRLYTQDLFPIEFAIPNSLDEQVAIAEQLDSIKGRIAQETETLAKLRRIRLGLTQDLLTGRKRVTALLESNQQYVTQAC